VQTLGRKAQRQDAIRNIKVNAMASAQVTLSCADVRQNAIWRNAEAG
jgi:hypothetical protein